MIGLRIWVISAQFSKNLFLNTSGSVRDGESIGGVEQPRIYSQVLSFISLMSAPADAARQRSTFSQEYAYTPAKALSLPVMTRAPTSSSSSNSRNALFSSMNSAEESALSAFGRLSVISATPSAGFEVRMFSYCVVDMRRRRRRAGEGEMRAAVGVARRACLLRRRRAMRALHWNTGDDVSREGTVWNSTPR